MRGTPLTPVTGSSEVVVDDVDVEVDDVVDGKGLSVEEVDDVGHAPGSRLFVVNPLHCAKHGLMYVVPLPQTCATVDEHDCVHPAVVPRLAAVEDGVSDVVV